MTGLPKATSGRRDGRKWAQCSISWPGGWALSPSLHFPAKPQHSCRSTLCKCNNLRNSVDQYKGMHLWEAIEKNALAFSWDLCSAFADQPCFLLNPLVVLQQAEQEFVDATENEILHSSQQKIMDINYTAGTADLIRFYKSLLQRSF